jgi:hypothetical protein
VERVGDQLESYGAIGESRSFVYELVAGRVLDPELAQIGADAVDRALMEFGAFAVAGFID